jgi:hypothetical protein
MVKKLTLLLSLAALPACGGCALLDQANVPKDPGEAAEYSQDVLRCAAIVGEQLKAAGKKTPVAATLAFCAAVEASPDLAGPQAGPQAASPAPNRVL